MKKSFIGLGVVGLGFVVGIISLLIRVSEDRRIYIESLGCVAFWSDDCDTLGQFYPLANILLGLGILLGIAGLILFFVFRKVPASPTQGGTSTTSKGTSPSGFCTGCGKALPENSAFCGACGKSVA